MYKLKMLALWLLSVVACLPFASGQIYPRPVVGQRCMSNFDCGNNAECRSGSCTCQDGYVGLTDGRCLPKVSPGETVCQSDVQCEAVWPATKCVNTMCQCTGGTSSVRTRDGTVCIKHGECPTGGAATVLRDESGHPAECSITSTGEMTGCLGQLHMYDCIRNRLNGTFYCCPSRANACHQPKVIGQAGFGPGAQQRFYFDQIQRDCLPFSYVGSGGNANNFLSQSHCSNYCNATCPRGHALFSSGEGGRLHQFAQTERSCIPLMPNACPDYRYMCLPLRPGRAICCPTVEFICGVTGGSAQDPFRSIFDEGVYCGPEKKVVTRYYYNARQYRCATFQYKGCAGNFNNFETEAECKLFCVGGQFAQLGLTLATGRMGSQGDLLTYGLSLANNFTNSAISLVQPRREMFNDHDRAFARAIIDKEAALQQHGNEQQQLGDYNQPWYGGFQPNSGFDNAAKQGNYQPNNVGSPNRGFGSDNAFTSNNDAPRIYSNSASSSGIASAPWYLGGK